MLFCLYLGPFPPQLVYFEDAILIGSFQAFEKGIVVCTSAGNSFLPSTANNVAPWILTVGTSTIDREFPSYVLHGNMKRLKRFGVNSWSDFHGCGWMLVCWRLNKVCFIIFPWIIYVIKLFKDLGNEFQKYFQAYYD